VTSQVENIRWQLEALASEADNVAAGLANFSDQFTQKIEVVRNTIGSTSTKAEEEIVDLLSTASDQVTGAIGALVQAAQKAKEYAASL
jgi:hypothetical protein